MSPAAAGALREVLAQTGEVGRDLMAVDWSEMALGEPETWSRSLKTTVRVVLSSRFSMWMAWGPELTFFCNDAYRRDTLAKKYPWALGRPAREVWAEIWPEIGPRIETVLRTGEATWDEALLLFLERSGYVEETYHTFSYSPLPDDDGQISGMLCVVTEDTERIIGEQRLSILRDLGAVPATAEGEPEFLDAAAAQLALTPGPLPFTLAYLFDDDGVAHLASRTGLPAGHPAAPASLDPRETDPPWPIGELAAGQELVVEQLGTRFGALPTGGWELPPNRALLVALPQPEATTPYGFLVVGVNPYRPLDSDYRSFVRLIAQRLAAGIATARSLGAERQRSEELAELDRAKTAFFSNVSHEFRTPLTLMLGPLHDAMVEAGRLEGENLELVQRNALRLLKLVGTLLVFSRVEAGRMRASFRPVDAARLTAEIASTFADVADRAGVSLEIDCPPLPEPLLIDPELWERIVLNLLSNAFKVTLKGGVSVSMRTARRCAELTIRDTGSGIPPGELRRLFQRFYRVQHAAGRSHEGTGIGLALVKQLVELHGGEVSVTSTVGVGSSFTVRLPFGREHLPADQVHERELEPMPTLAPLFLEEAHSWDAEAQDAEAQDAEAQDAEAQEAGKINADPLPLSRLSRDQRSPGGARVLIADDNRDLRRYLQRLLSTHFEVEAVADGVAALEVIRKRPVDLLISDVMMPGLDGFGLLSELRSRPETRELPVIMLSARAGEEASLEGLRAGADDYLPKPFSGSELLGRVFARLELAQLRQKSSEEARAERRRLEQMLRQLPAGVVVAEAPSGRIAIVNEQVAEILGHPGGAGDPGAVTPALAEELLSEARWPLARAVTYGVVTENQELRLRTASEREKILRVSASPVRDEQERIFAAVLVLEDMTERVRNQQLLAHQRDILALIARGEPLEGCLEAIVASAEGLTEPGARAAILLASEGDQQLEHDVSDPGAQGAPTARWSTPILATNGELVGTLSILHEQALYPSDEDRHLGELLARTAAVAIERARDVSARTQQLAELQSGLLPRALPAVPGIDSAVLFRPGDRGLSVGGDFYDLFPLPDGSWAFVVGDVCGHGAEAAAVTALTRHTTRAVARLDAHPSRVLAGVNDALRYSEHDRFCTAVCGRLLPGDEGARVELANGGHPAPLIRRVDGSVEAADAHGPLVGIFERAEFPCSTYDLRPGDALLLYTDGLIERNPRVGDDAALRELLAGLPAPEGADELLAMLEYEALGTAQDRLRDDVAVLVLQAYQR